MLTTMKAASRKNMMSISGMISSRPRLRGSGDIIFIQAFLELFRLAQRTEEHFHVGAGRLNLELKFRDLRREVIEKDQRHHRDGQSAGRGDERLRDAAGDRRLRQL